MTIKWRQLEAGFWFGETNRGDWTSVACPVGGRILALVQPVNSGCHTGCFDTVAEAKSWAQRKLTTRDLAA